MRWVTAVVAAALITSACQAAPEQQDAGSFEPETTTTATAPAQAEATTPSVETTTSLTLPIEPNPTSLSYAYEESATVSELVGPAGGTIAAVGTNGSTFELEIPAGALLSEEVISMTPASEVAGSVLDQTLATAIAVRLEPEGLILFEPAELTIANGDLSVESQPFATVRDGEELHLVPSDTQAGVATVAIYHFSEYGVALLVTSNLQEIVSQYVTTDQDTRAQTQLAIVERHATDTQALEWSRQTIMQLWGDTLLNRMSAAGRSDEALTQATGEFHWWGEQVAHLRLRASLHRLSERIYEAWLSAVDVAIRRAHQHCIRDQSPEAAFTAVRWLAITRWTTPATTVNGVPVQALRERLDTWRALVDECFSFDVTYETTVVIAAGGSTVTTSTSSRIPITLDSTGIVDETLSSPAVSGDILVTGVVSEPREFCAMITGSGSTHVILDLELNLIERDISRTTVDAVRLIMTIDPKIKMLCGTPLNTDVTDAFWWFPLTQANKRLVRATTYWVVDLPIVENGNAYAEWTDTRRPVDGGTVSQTLRVIHTPRG